MARLTVMRGSDKAGPRFDDALDKAVRRLDALRPDAARARGETRDELMGRLSQIESELADAAIASLEDADRIAHRAGSRRRARAVPDAHARRRVPAITPPGRAAPGAPAFRHSEFLIDDDAMANAITL